MAFAIPSVFALLPAFIAVTGSPTLAARRGKKEDPVHRLSFAMGMPHPHPADPALPSDSAVSRPPMMPHVRKPLQALGMLHPPAITLPKVNRKQDTLATKEGDSPEPVLTLPPMAWPRPPLVPVPPEPWPFGIPFAKPEAEEISAWNQEFWGALNRAYSEPPETQTDKKVLLAEKYWLTSVIEHVKTAGLTDQIKLWHSVTSFWVDTVHGHIQDYIAAAEEFDDDLQLTIASSELAKERPTVIDEIYTMLNFAYYSAMKAIFPPDVRIFGGVNREDIQSLVQMGDYEARKERGMRANRVLHLAFKDDILVGFCTSTLQSPLLQSRVGRLGLLVVHPDYHSAGVGTALIKAAEDRLADACAEIEIDYELTGSRGYAEQVREWYEDRLGFKELGGFTWGYNQRATVTKYRKKVFRGAGKWMGKQFDKVQDRYQGKKTGKWIGRQFDKVKDRYQGIIDRRWAESSNGESGEKDVKKADPDLS